jgi:hypothetical protein
MRILRVLILIAVLVGVTSSIHGASARPASAIKVAVAVTPNPISYGSSAYVSVATVPGAMCTSSVVYNNGSTPSNWQGTYKGKAFRAGSNGVIIWTWTFKARHLSSGKATVTCTSNKVTTSSTTTFKLS